MVENRGGDHDFIHLRERDELFEVLSGGVGAGAAYEGVSQHSGNLCPFVRRPIGIDIADGGLQVWAGGSAFRFGSEKATPCWRPEVDWCNRIKGRVNQLEFKSA